MPTPDAPGEFPTAFVDAVADAVKHQNAPSKDVAVALALGWYLAALSHPGAVVKSAAAARGDLAGLGALTEGQVLDYCASQVEVACARLRELVEKCGLALPELTDLRASLETDGRQAAADPQGVRRGGGGQQPGARTCRGEDRRHSSQRSVERLTG